VSTQTIQSLLERAGFHVRGATRADCAHCQGTTRGTVSFNNAVAFCHRCKWTANIRQLSHGLGIVPPKRAPEDVHADATVARFKQWLADRCRVAAETERRLAQRAELAKRVLAKWPDEFTAWDALAKWFHAQRTFQDFWDLASCRTGRIELFKTWVANGRS
jgi:hypothetical protein